MEAKSEVSSKKDDVASSADKNASMKDGVGRICANQYCQKALTKWWACAACKVAVYCDVRCQKADWPFHQYTCKHLQSSEEQLAAGLIRALPAWMKKRSELSELILRCAENVKIGPASGIVRVVFEPYDKAKEMMYKTTTEEIFEYCREHCSITFQHFKGHNDPAKRQIKTIKHPTFDPALHFAVIIELRTTESIKTVRYLENRDRLNQ